jgi:hypothetical protein
MSFLPNWRCIGLYPILYIPTPAGEMDHVTHDRHSPPKFFSFTSDGNNNWFRLIDPTIDKWCNNNAGYIYTAVFYFYLNKRSPDCSPFVIIRDVKQKQTNKKRSEFSRELATSSNFIGKKTLFLYCPITLFCFPIASSRNQKLLQQWLLILPTRPGTPAEFK